MKISIIIPVFNESQNLPLLYDRIKKALEKDFPKFNYEILFIDDGSSDKSFKILSNIKIKNQRIKILKFDKNYGQQIAISAGLKYASGDYFAVMDSDLQNRPEEIITLYKKLRKGYNIVYSIRKKYTASFFKKYSSRIFWIFLKIVTFLNIPTNQSMLKIFDKRILKRVNSITDANPFFPVLFYKAGLKQGTQPVKNDNRYKGNTKYNLGKMIKLTFAAFSYNPVIYFLKRKGKPNFKIVKKLL